jgi:hypothetical protein
VYPRVHKHNKVIFCSLIFEELPSSLISENALMKRRKQNDIDTASFPVIILVNEETIKSEASVVFHVLSCLDTLHSVNLNYMKQLFLNI